MNQVIVFLDNKNIEFSILTDNAAFWINRKKSNPLPIDWMQNVEIGNAYEKLKKSGKLAFVVSKYELRSLGGLSVKQRFIQGSYEDNFERIDINENRYLTLRNLINDKKIIFTNDFFSVYY